MSEEKNKTEAGLLEEMDRTSKLLVRRDLELRRVNEELDEKIKILEEDETRLQEMNEILEIRLKARTRQLMENINDLDRQVKERTQRIEDSKEALSAALENVKKEKNVAEEEKEKTLAIIRNFSDGLLSFDSGNMLVGINPKVEEYLGIRESAVAGKDAAQLASIAQLVSFFALIGTEIHEISRKEFKVRQNLILEVSVIPIRRAQEQGGKFILLHDITREKTVEKLKSEFVSIAAHQLRTPLTSIKWIITSLLAGDFGALNPDQQEYLQKTDTSNERMINLVDDLLNLSRIEEGRYIQTKDLFSLEELIDKSIENAKIKLQKKNLELSFEKIEGVPQVLADKEKIRLVVQNLIENAANYSLTGGKIVVTLEEDQTKNEVVFSVQDNGIGIPDDQKSRIFTKFFRAENAVHAETVGSGLGLFINKNIIESHGGRIWFESENDKGTVFSFALPLGKK